MSRYRLVAQAKHDLAEIWSFVAQDSGARADRLMERFGSTFRTVAAQPGIGRPREELRPGLRSFPVGRYLVFYKRVEPYVDILRVVHGARDLTALFGGNDDTDDGTPP